MGLALLFVLELETSRLAKGLSEKEGRGDMADLVIAEIVNAFRAPDGTLYDQKGEVYQCSEEDFERLQKAGCLKPYEGERLPLNARQLPKEGLEPSAAQKLSEGERENIEQDLEEVFEDEIRESEEELDSSEEDEELGE